jgi:hypothetical protein
VSVLQKDKPLCLPFGGTGRRVEVGPIRFTAAAFGQPYEYTLNHFQKPDDAKREPQLALRIAQALVSVDATEVYATRPSTANAKIVERHVLNQNIYIGHGVTLRRNGKKPADGTMLGRNQASAMTAGGGPRVVLVRGSKMVDAHAGRDSLLERTDVVRSVRVRKHASVIDSMLEKLDVRSDLDAAEVSAYVFYAIKPERFTHETTHHTYGGYNANLPTYIAQRWRNSGGQMTFTKDGTVICLDLPMLIRAQLVKLGVPESQIDLSSAYAPDDLLYDTRGENPSARNLVVISRHA